MAIQNMEAFREPVLAVGLDLQRSQIKEAMGNYVVDLTTPTVVRAGMLVQQNVGNQLIEVCTGTIPFGFAKFDCTTQLYGAVVGEYIQLNAFVATSLAHNNLFDSGVGSIFTVRVADALTGGAYTQDTNYTCDEANGTIVRLGGGIADGAWVYVNYLFALSAADLARHGRNWWNTTNSAEYQGGRFTVITDWALIFTANYDPSFTYTVGQQLYAGRTAKNKSGLVCGNNTEGETYIGRCYQVPTPTDPFLGVKYVGGMVA
jgi:hypothetical protein